MGINLISVEKFNKHTVQYGMAWIQIIHSDLEIQIILWAANISHRFFFLRSIISMCPLGTVTNKHSIFQELVVRNESLDSENMSRNLMDEIFGTSLTRDQDEEGQQQQEDEMDNRAHAPETLRDPAQPHDAHDRTGLDLNRSLDVNRVSDFRRSKRHHEGEARVNNGRQDLEVLVDTQGDTGIDEGGEQQVDNPMVLLDNVTSRDDLQQAARVNSFTPPDAVDGDGGTTAGSSTAAVGAGQPAVGLVSPGIRESEPPPGAADTGPGDGDREESYSETDEGREESDSGGLPGLLSSPGADAEEEEGGAGAGVERVETSDHEELARENITVVGE
jgi:hypothetical protein